MGTSRKYHTTLKINKTLTNQHLEKTLDRTNVMGDIYTIQAQTQERY